LRDASDISRSVEASRRTLRKNGTLVMQLAQERRSCAGSFVPPGDFAHERYLSEEYRLRQETLRDAYLGTEMCSSNSRKHCGGGWKKYLSYGSLRIWEL